MNNIWSDNIQGIKTLYLSRKLRFNDMFLPQYELLFGINKNERIRILEIGCGPGALAGALHRWYPNAEIVGIDRDSKFIEFAKANEPEIVFLEGDATALPFEDGSFDVVISNTVCEHIETKAFFEEQRRVLKDGGVCLVLSARKGVNYRANCLEMTEVEKDFWNSNGDGESLIEEYRIAKYCMSEQELPKSMEKNGFTNVFTGYAVIDLTPDNPKYSKQMALDMFEAERMSDIEAVELSHAKDLDKILDIVNAKYEKRVELYNAGEKQWDTSTSITMVIRGVK